MSPFAPHPASEGYFIGSDSTRLFYRTVGTGPDTVVVVHGYQGNNQNYLAPDLDPLARGRTLLFYDQRGGGRSESVRDPERLGLDDHVRDLEALRRHFRLERLSMFGHSGGAVIATRYALDHPGKVGRVLLVAAPPLVRGQHGAEIGRSFYARLDSATWARMNALQESLPTAQDPTAVCREIVRTTLPAAFFADRAAFERMRGDFCAAPPEKLRTSAERLGAFQQSISGVQWEKGLHTLKAPVLVVHGDHDVIPVASARELTAVLPDARVLVMRDADHLPWVEQPAQFFSAADRFFDGAWPETAEAVP